MVRRAQEEDTQATVAEPGAAKPAETAPPDAAAPLLPPAEQDVEIFGPPPPERTGNVEARPAVEETGALEPSASQPPDAGVVKPPAPPKPKPKRKPAKAQAKADPGAPLVLVPPQKIGKPRKREPNFLERIFGRDDD
ncbi:MAG: hypothetical protein AB7R87_07580 [Parvibaculaceae bacterium]